MGKQKAKKGPPTRPRKKRKTKRIAIGGKATIRRPPPELEGGV